MTVFVNGKQSEIEKGLDVAAFLSLKKLDPKKVFVSVNGEVVESEKHASLVIKENDRLELVSFVGGG